MENIQDQMGNFSWKMETIKNNQKEMLKILLYSKGMQKTFRLISRFEQPRKESMNF